VCLFGCSFLFAAENWILCSKPDAFLPCFNICLFHCSLPFVQVIAFFLRPDKDSKIRRYWNWYHHSVGRLALFLAVVNIFLGIRVGGAGTSWKVGYGINLGVLLIATVILEIILWTRWSRKTVAPTTF